jgi:hypothetical protein
VAAVLTACAVGTPFSRPPEDFVRLGETTRAQIEQRFGRPDDEESFRQDGVAGQFVQYTYMNDAEPPKMPNTLCMRQLGFALVDGVVFAEHFVSDCASDHTDFDERKASTIIKGQTHCSEVVAILGRPSYRATYPLTTEKGDMHIGYSFQYMKRPPLQLNMYEKSLQVVCDANDVVQKITFIESGDR